MSTLTAAQLSPIFNGFTIHRGPPRTIELPKAKKLAALAEVTVTGTLIAKQYVALDAATGMRKSRLGAGNGRYSANTDDGDLHFCLGTAQGKPHIACELQNAKSAVTTFNDARGGAIAVTGFFRCMFEHPGFNPKDDSHVLEIHPVRAVRIGGATHAFDVDIPDQNALHAWSAKLNKQDARMTARYDKAKDRLTFAGMGLGDTNYVKIDGKVSNVKIKATSTRLASFTIQSTSVGHDLTGYCLKGSTAALQLAKLKKKSVRMVALRNVDLKAALKSRYEINLLAIDIQS